MFHIRVPEVNSPSEVGPIGGDDIADNLRAADGKLERTVVHIPRGRINAASVSHKLCLCCCGRVAENKIMGDLGGDVAVDSDPASVELRYVPGNTIPADDGGYLVIG